MMLKYFLFVFTFTIALAETYAQTVAGTDEKIATIPTANTQTTDDIVTYIKQHFPSDTGRVRAIYVWITNNINYDVAKLKAYNNTSEPSRQTVTNVLQTRNAVCQGYADLFIELCNKLAIPASFVGGYTKRDGKVSTIPHAWTAVKLDNRWYLFDPTWGAGYIKNDQFIRHATFSFYKRLPEDMIKDHMPFDPMYQFLNYPVTNKEFIDGQQNTAESKPIFNFNDTLKFYATLSPADKLISEARRLEANGIRNDMLLERLNFIKKGLEPIAFNEANTALKQSIDLFNIYIAHKNKQFSTVEDKELLESLDSISHY